MKNIKAFDTYINENYNSEVNELFGFGKKKIKLDDVNPSKDALQFSEKHPVAKILLRDFVKFGIIGDIAKKAIQAIYDFADGVPMISKYDLDYDKASHVLTIGSGKGLFSGSPIMGG